MLQLIAACFQQLLNFHGRFVNRNHRSYLRQAFLQSFHVGIVVAAKQKCVEHLQIEHVLHGHLVQVKESIVVSPTIE